MKKLILLFISLLFLSGQETNLIPAPDFIVANVDGNMVILDSLLKKGPVIITFWALWCDMCIKELDALKTYATYNLELIGGVERLIKDGIEPEAEVKRETKPYIEATYNLGPFFIEAGYEHNFISEDAQEYYEHAGSIATGKPELFVFTLRYERRSQIIEHLSDEKDWPLAELSIDLTHRHNLRIRAGAEKGGLVCSGGVCRFEEPFKGIKIVLNSIF